MSERIEIGDEVEIIGPSTKGDSYFIGYPIAVKVEQINQLGILVGDSDGEEGWNDFFPATSLRVVYKPAYRKIFAPSVPPAPRLEAGRQSLGADDN